MSKKGYFTKERLAYARESRAFYNEFTGKDKPFKEFLKDEENPTNKIIENNFALYEITYSLDYQGEGYNFKIEQETVQVYALRGDLNKQYISEQVRDGVAQKFMGKSFDWVKDRLEVQGEEVGSLRGIEQAGLSKNDYNKIIENRRGVIKNGTVQVSKARGRIKAKTNDYDLNLWF